MSVRSVHQTLFAASQRRYPVGESIAAGGEGSIHEVQGQSGFVIKLYNQDRLQRLTTTTDLRYDLSQKIGLMQSRPPTVPAGLPTDREHPYWTWPIESLHTRDGDFVGYLMPKVSGVKGELFLQFTSGFSWRARLLAARNLAKLVEATHEAGYIIGDLNQRNLFFSDSEVAGSNERGRADDGPMILPSITDTDSFQVNGPNGEILFPCRVQNPEYSPPELINVMTSGPVDRTREQDYFTLAIIIFQLLSLGAHPFMGTLPGSVRQELRRNIERGHNVLFSKEFIRPKQLIDLEVLPPDITGLFQRTFELGHTVTRSRASANEWDEVLSQVLHQGLTVCSVEARHYYSSHLAECPWCKYAQRIGADPFRLSKYSPQPLPRRTDRAGRSSLPAPETAGSAPPRREPEQGWDDLWESEGAAQNVVGDSPRRREPELAPKSTAPAPGNGWQTLFQAEESVTRVDPSKGTSDPKAPQEKRRSPPVWLSSPGSSLQALAKPFRSPPFLIAFLALLALGLFAFRNGADTITEKLRNLFANRQGEVETAAGPSGGFGLESDPGPFSIIIDVCRATVAPFDCTGAAQPLPQRPGLTVKRHPGTIFTPASASDGNKDFYHLRDLESGIYTVTIHDSALTGEFVRCASSDPTVNPEGRVFTFELNANKHFTFVYCARSG